MLCEYQFSQIHNGFSPQQQIAFRVERAPEKLGNVSSEHYVLHRVAINNYVYKTDEMAPRVKVLCCQAW